MASCSRCAKLELEVAKLRQLLAQHSVEIAESDDVELNGLALPPFEISDIANPLRRSRSILIRRESGRIQCLRDMLEDLTPSTDIIEATRRSSRVNPTTAVVVLTEQAPYMDLPVVVAGEVKENELSASVHRQSVKDLPKPLVITKVHKEVDNQALDVPAAHHPLTGIEDKSLGDLFKYAIVITGPMARPKKNAFSAFFKNTDFRRSRSVHDGGGPNGDAALSRKASTAAAPPREAADTKMGPPVQTLQDFLLPDASRVKVNDGKKLIPPGSPAKKPTGWLSNIVPPRFRSGSTDAPPIPHAKPSEVVKPDTQELLAVNKPVPVKVDPTKPRMIAVSPPPGKGGVAELEGLFEICFPYGEKLPPLSDFSVANLKRTLQERHRTYRSPDSTFVLTIASVNNPTEITYAVCVHLPLFPDDESGTGPDNVDKDGEKLPSHGCISLLSNYPFFSLFFKVVFGIASIWESRRKEYVQDHAIALKEKKAPPTPLTVQDFVDHFEGVLKRMKEMRVPAMGGWTRLVLAPQYTPLAFHRPHSEGVKAERRMLVLEYAAPMLFAQLSVDQVLFLLGCLCCERKVLVVSDHANIVSSCVLALTTLLEPLQWAGPVITLLPPRLDELLEAPVPLIAGRVSINSGAIPNFSTLTKPMNGVIEMNMDQNNLCMHEEDLMAYHELKLPGCDALVHELQHFSSQLFERHLSPDFPSIEQIQACDAICSRIQRHMQSICSIATGEATTLDVSNPLYCVSPRRKAAGGSSSDPVWTQRCSEAVQDYIRRFQDTQMFSMFKLQRQDEREEEEIALDDDDDGGDDDDNDSNEPTNDVLGKSKERSRVSRTYSSDEDADDARDEGHDTDTLFVEEAVSYETLA